VFPNYYLPLELIRTTKVCERRNGADVHWDANITYAAKGAAAAAAGGGGRRRAAAGGGRRAARRGRGSAAAGPSRAGGWPGAGRGLAGAARLGPKVGPGRSPPTRSAQPRRPILAPALAPPPADPASNLLRSGATSATYEAARRFGVWLSEMPQTYQPFNAILLTKRRWLEAMLSEISREPRPGAAAAAAAGRARSTPARARVSRAPAPPVTHPPKTRMGRLMRPQTTSGPYTLAATPKP
jgi:hypothetical protein